MNSSSRNSANPLVVKVHQLFNHDLALGDDYLRQENRILRRKFGTRVPLTKAVAGSMNATASQPVEICGRDATLRFDGIAHDVTTFGIEPAGHNRKSYLLKGYERGKTPGQPNHAVDWVNCIQSRGTPKCSTDEAFIETATFLMSLVSQQERRVVRLDAAKEAIV